MPAMNDETVRSLLGEILSTEHDATLASGGRVETTYDAGALGSFSVTLVRQSDGGVAAIISSRAKRSVGPRRGLTPRLVASAPREASAPSVAAAPTEATAFVAPSIEFAREAPLALQDASSRARRVCARRRLTSQTTVAHSFASTA